MQLLTGPPGSGKTFRALETLRGALRRGESDVRLLVPTATMAQHLRNELAREGWVFPPAVVQTISRFIEPWVAEVPEVSSALFTILVDQAVRQLDLPELRRVVHFEGLRARLASAIEECAAASCTPRELHDPLRADGLGRALARVFQEVQRALDARRLALRPARLQKAAEQIRDQGTAGARTIWLDGFFSLTDAEMSVIQAMAEHADVTVTLPADDVTGSTRARLLSVGFREQRLSRQRVAPARELVMAPAIEREVDEIARRILDQASAGRPFREMGVIVRTPDAYVALLRSTLERFGIPARFYFDSVLREQPAVRFLEGAIDAMLGGWQHEQSLAVIKLAPGTGTSAPMDRFDFEIRRRMPGEGLTALREMAAGIESTDHRLRRLLERFQELDSLRQRRLTPREWSAQIAELPNLYRPPRPADGVSHACVLEWRSQAQALDGWRAAAAEAANTFESPARISLGEFWQAVKAILRLTPLRLRDQRRNVVHVLSAYEARQWELGVVFVCGLVEGQFPGYQTPDPFLPEPVRRRLKERGIRIRTNVDAEGEERFLFDSALSRATASVVMSYPKYDAGGELNLPSLFLDREQTPTESRGVRVRTQPATGPAVRSIHSADLLQVLRQRHAEMRPTALESYLQCPFQFFAGQTLKLEGKPLRPEQRLDFRLRGTIVHQVIKEWLDSRDSIEAVFARVFGEQAEKASVVASYGTELVRMQMLEDVRRFAKQDAWPADHESQTEVPCRFELQDGLMIRCRLDRLLKAPDGRAFIIDYKYSANARNYVADEEKVQGPLYWLAAERGFHLDVAGVYYCSLRDGIDYRGWGEKPDWLKAKVEPSTAEWLTSAIDRSVQSALSITGGRITPAPADVAKCRNCDFRDACRYTATAIAGVECAE